MFMHVCESKLNRATRALAQIDTRH